MAHPMRVDHVQGLASFVAQLDCFRGVLAGLSEADFTAASRCRGWSVADVVVHVHLGLQEMMRGVVTPSTRDPDTDAATYWSDAFQAGDVDPAQQLQQRNFVRLLSVAYGRPSQLTTQLELTAAALTTAVTAMPSRAGVLPGSRAALPATSWRPGRSSWRFTNST